MIFITAIPDDYYFLWQLEVQLYNFGELNIKAQDIRVLIGHNQNRELRLYFKEFIEKHSDKALFFVYCDRRIKNAYPSSLRPYLIRQYLADFPEVENQAFFYYDTDIIFRELPDFEEMLKNEIWYVADTRRYLDSDYVKSSSSNDLFFSMCKAVNISPKLVKDNDVNCGGAQYLIKKTNTAFWEKVEKDCELLYDLTESYNINKADLSTKHGGLRSSYKGIQSWCADMWSIFWNALLFGHTVKIHPDLDFCWPMDKISEWNRKKILHYAGKIEKNDKQFFRKGNYTRYEPFYDVALKKICDDNCSYPLVKIINACRLERDKERINLTDVAFLITVKATSESDISNVYYITNYLSKYFDTHIIIAETDPERNVDVALLPSCCTCLRLKDEASIVDQKHVLDGIVSEMKSAYIALWQPDWITPVIQLYKAVELLRKNSNHVVFPFDGIFIRVDSLFKEMFGKILDDQLLLLNKSKFATQQKTIWGGPFLLSRDTYLINSANCDNLIRFSGSNEGPFIALEKEDNELIMVNGPLFYFNK